MSNLDPPTTSTGEPISQPALEPTQDERTLAMICHLLGLLMFTSIPFANIIGPLVLWQIKKNESAFLDDQGKEVVNFQIAVSLALIVCGLLFCVLFCIFFIVLIPIAAILIADVVYIIIGAMKSNQGEAYRYPYTWRLIR